MLKYLSFHNSSRQGHSVTHPPCSKLLCLFIIYTQAPKPTRWPEKVSNWFLVSVLHSQNHHWTSYCGHSFIPQELSNWFLRLWTIVDFWVLKIETRMDGGIGSRQNSSKLLKLVSCHPCIGRCALHILLKVPLWYPIIHA
jgi:hypothetical protein